MANAATAEDHVTLNLGEGGAVVATDYVATAFGYDGSVGPAHFQVIKLSTGAAGEHALMSADNPLPAQIASIGNSGFLTNGFVAVRGNTMGTQAVPVSLSGATLEVNDITVIGGTIDRVVGASCDIRSIASGITLSVVGLGGNNSVAVTGDVKVGTGVSADIRSLPLPTGMTTFTNSFNDSTLKLFSSFTCESGIKVKNYFSGLEGFTPGLSGPGGGLLCVGFTGTLAAGGSSGFLLAPGEEVFIEVKNINKLMATSVNFDAATTFVNMSILGT